MSLQDGRKVIAFDFDGVLHEYTGWNGGKLGRAMPGMVEVVRQLLAKGAHVVVHTTRTAEDIGAWLVAQGYGPLDVYNAKWSRIDVFVDDRACLFTPALAAQAERFVAELLAFEPHWRQPERCPRCDSPRPGLHPAVQHEGEVEICRHPWHGPAAEQVAATVVEVVLTACDQHGPIAPRYATELVTPIIAAAMGRPC